jgi:hypothetical protein
MEAGSGFLNFKEAEKFICGIKGCILRIPSGLKGGRHAL